MEVVRKDYLPYLTEEKKQNNQKQRPQKQKKNSYRFVKIATAFSISCLLMLGLLLVIRYAAITEMKHEIYNLSRQLDEIEDSREKLKVELEKVTKSRWIESEAVNRLGMMYPISENTYYFSVNSTKTALLTNDLNKNMNTEDTVKVDENGFIQRTINKFAALLKI
ncbi:hypothetical protein [Alkaliphilus peptidifermentans]|uniref:Cell division protein FtsL n=1 Tax=Alkaliphilus peptidifermentans DSM 18978 TaxID=1120976 RepID=A0A1G5BFI0_9FIRM|nr:hypothetical protein [Alkaliphilus peptidifermentans]SCX88935.1 hypothetical protein SAMN03080606_00401 [Alkaliphilus peptidifermentans DSM 18978]